jgi:hypothetical protein
MTITIAKSANYFFKMLIALLIIKNASSSDQFEEIYQISKKFNLPISIVEINNSIAVSKTHFKIFSTEEIKLSLFIKSLNRILKTNKILDTKFLLCSYDYAPENLFEYINPEASPPIFTFSISTKHPYFHKFILIPDDITLSDQEIGYVIGWKEISKEILKANEESKWENKINEAIWRGKLTDTENRLNNNFTPREIAVKLSKKYPNKLNAKFVESWTEKIPYIRRVVEYLYTKYSIDPYLNKTDQIRYKILLNLDGHTSTYPGFLWKLLSNSVTLKQESNNIQWFYPALKPWIHYIPVNNNLSDLLAKIEWIQNNDTEAKKIADESTKFVQENLMISNIESYLAMTLNSYAKLQTNK